MSTSPAPFSSDPLAASRWRVARRLLVAAAAVATLIAVFYTVENWRGKRAWENCRRELTAQGEVLDWAAYIPAPIPDEQNFFKAPHMREWFVKEPSGGVQTPNAPKSFVPSPRKDTHLVLAEVKVVAPDAAVDAQAANVVLRFDDPAAREQAAKLLGETLGPCALGCRNCVLVARPLAQIKPLHLVLQADTVPTIKELTAFFPSNPLTNSALAFSELSYLQVAPAGSNTFRVRVCLKEPVYGAADYLAWTEPQAADFDLVRKALERPYARMECDYQQPFATAMLNFVQIRNVVQTLSQRAQCHLLLGEPEAAWHELALVHDFCRVLGATSPGTTPPEKPMTLVAGMLNVAISGLYAGIVEDGLRLHAWREPQLAAIERQVQETDLLGLVAEAFREERAAACHTFETTKRSELAKMINGGSSRRTWRDKLSDSASLLALTCVPRGWYYQNMVVDAEAMQEVLRSIEPAKQLVLPHQGEKYHREIQARLRHRTPYTFLAAIAIPNFFRATQTVARNQTLLNQAGLACALERYRLAQGQYPETLDGLAPRFIEKLPHDVIGGQPLKYRRTEGRGYLLYSVGWDEKDSGGVAAKSMQDGDWVWELR